MKFTKRMKSIKETVDTNKRLFNSRCIKLLKEILKLNLPNHLIVQ
jgi:hypothetical protein